MDRNEHRDEGRSDAEPGESAESTADSADVRLTAYALGELDEAESADVEALLARDADAREQVRALRALAGELRHEMAAEAGAAPAPGLGPAQRQRIEQELVSAPADAPVRRMPPSVWRVVLIPALAAGLLIAVAVWQLDDRGEPQSSGTDVVVDGPHAPDAKDELPPAEQLGHVSDGSLALEISEAAAPPPATEGEPSAFGGHMMGGTVIGPAAGVGKTANQAADPVAAGRMTFRARKSAAEPVDAQLLQLGYVGYVASGSTTGALAVGAGAALPAGDDKSRLHEPQLYFPRPAPGTEGYASIVEETFRSPLGDPLSTFSIDVDTASYANVRRFLLKEGRLPPADAVRIEELVNYFRYAYPQPDGEVPFAVSVAVTECPWAGQHRLVRIGLQGREVDAAERAPSNLVFLVDVSGSMNATDKLPLLVTSLRLLVQRLDGRDRVALVTYAGNAGLVLDSTVCTPEGKGLLLDALQNLRAGGSTHGSAGIQKAYETARAHFVEGGTNRVILATDGDFNVGVTSKDELQRLITASAKSGVFLSVLGFGTGNLQDGTAELLADKGNGNYSYIDSTAEAQKVLVEQMGGTLITIAKDVKIQVEFNPARVASYRLVGYENRALAAQDFRDDRKDAGEIGAGHAVTALYEIVPVGAAGPGVPGVDPLRYQQPPAPAAPPALTDSPELLYVKLRWKQPEADTSTEMALPVTDDGRKLAEADPDTTFAAAVAAFGMLLRDSEHAGEASFQGVLALAERGRGLDEDGYRAEFLRMVKVAMGLARPGDPYPLAEPGDVGGQR